ncbi:MAG: hypothetical protein HY686_05145 [Chloroflexi bacterium]|nr:hypothetical protein [Chloroflexota bacterium]
MRHSEGVSTSRDKPRHGLKDEVYEMRRAVTRMERRILRGRYEFNRLRALDSKANTHSIVGSTLVGLGLFLVSGVPVPNAASATLAAGAQVGGASLSVLGFLILVNAYRDWRAMVPIRHGVRAHHRRTRLLLLVVLLGLVVMVAALAWTASQTFFPWLGIRVPALDGFFPR